MSAISVTVSTKLHDGHCKLLDDLNYLPADTWHLEWVPAYYGPEGRFVLQGRRTGCDVPMHNRGYRRATVRVIADQGGLVPVMWDENGLPLRYVHKNAVP